MATDEVKDAPKQMPDQHSQQSLEESSIHRQGIEQKVAQLCSKQGGRQGEGKGMSAHKEGPRKASASFGSPKKSRLFSRMKVKPSTSGASLSLSMAMDMRARNSLKREALFKIFERKPGLRPNTDLPSTSIKPSTEEKDVVSRKKKKSKKLKDAISRAVKLHQAFAGHGRHNISQASASFAKDKSADDVSKAEIEPEVEDPLRLSALKFSKAVANVDCERKTAGVSDAWDFLCGPTDDRAKTSDFLSLKGKATETCDNVSNTVNRADLKDLKESQSALTSTSRKETVQTLRGPKQRTALHVHPASIVSTLASLQDNVTRLMSDAGEKVECDPQGLKVKFKQFVPHSISRPDETTSDSEEYEDDDSVIDVEEAIEISDSEFSESSESSLSGDEEQNIEKPEKRVVRRRQREQSNYCEICEKSFSKLERHYLQHTAERSFKCNECGKGFVDRRTLQKHKTTHVNKYKCGICGEAFSKVRAAKRHAKIHLPEKPYLCEVCKASFKTRTELRKHMIVHLAVKRYMCDLCGRGVRSKTALKTHMRSHTGEKPFVCEICGKSFRYSSGLRVHGFTHTSGKPYRCLLCNESFAHNYLLKRHRLTHEGEPSQASDHDSSADASMNFASHMLNAVYSSPQYQLSNLNMTYAMSLQEPFQQQVPFAPQMEPLASSVKSSISSTQEMPPNSNSTELPAGESTPQVGQSQPLPVQAEPSHTIQSTLETPQTQHIVPQVNQSVPSVGDVPVLLDLSTKVNDPVVMQKCLGLDMLEENLMYGSGSRKQTVQDSIVIPLCDGSYKALKQLQAEREKS